MNHANIVKSSEVSGVKVKNSLGEDLGEINEVVIDKLMGKVNYLVLDFGGFLGFGNKFFAVPWDLFTYDKKNNCFLLNIDKESLKNAPGFDKDHWPNFAAPEYISTLNKYYH
ncbi:MULTISPECIES: PRC-barrel domain-containing protein [Legionella]|uniref:PRC-barrel domain-containing protein n=1 Tax=Legionella donaldsonii TaxID=45060 RepID=A0A378J593_9GAMM|nr:MULTISPECIES: PRC-barrel domain-containing protein [Legionella]MCC5015904.1 PRC-barrel domain-containing protein [Legionella sp. 31fI33]STX42428.1 PRC-barrel domain-containing protein [Legionella donaldsonii]